MNSESSGVGRCSPSQEIWKAFVNPFWLLDANKAERRGTFGFRILPSVHATWLATGSEVELKDGKTMFNTVEGETGMDRLRMMYTKTDSGIISPELLFISKTVSLSMIVGSFIGVTFSSRDAINTVVRKNQASVFNHQFEAKRFFQDNITLILMRNSFKWAWRLSLFTGMYSTFATSVAVYNNKASIWEHIAAGALCGTIWKLTLGLRASAVGGALGGTLGLICGSMVELILWSSGTSIEELRYWHHEYWESEYLNKVKKRNEESINAS